MAINAANVKSSGGGFRQPILEAGGYPGRLVQVIDLGLQPQSFNGEEKEPKNQIMVTYELSDEFCVDEDGNVLKDKPRWISEDFPLNSLDSDKAKSTARYKVLDPKIEHGGDWGQLVGAPCLVNIIVNQGKGKNAGREFNNVSGISLLRAKEAANLPDLVNKPVVFDLENPDVEVFNSLPAFIQDRIKSNLEFNGSKLQRLLKGEDVEETNDSSDEPW